MEEAMVKVKDKLILPMTKKALAKFDATQAHRDAVMQLIKSDEDLKAWQRMENIALRVVQTAFHHDTQDRNSLENCKLMGIDRLRELVERLGG